MRTIIIIALLLSSFKNKSQTINQHLLGISVGFFALPEIVNSKFDIGGSYVYAHNNFYSRIEGGYSPNSNFGNITRLFLFAGVTTDINKQISLHVEGGLGGFSGNKEYVMDSINYELVGGPYKGNIGFLFQPKFDHKLFIGFDMTFSTYEIYPTGWIEINKYNKLRRAGATFLFNVTLSYKLNFFKNEKVSIDDPIESIKK